MLSYKYISKKKRVRPQHRFNSKDLYLPTLNDKSNINISVLYPNKQK